ncbi:hypothetical protein [Nocardia sp. NPDC057227]|uniref:hypothetical protein n=1 Tax=Nocardia sp. NPDC057227 TaxID=3346056 RepID=UPI0036447A7C
MTDIDPLDVAEYVSGLSDEHFSALVRHARPDGSETADRAAVRTLFGRAETVEPPVEEEKPRNHVPREGRTQQRPGEDPALAVVRELFQP